jgi:hypothetical protein
MPRRESIPTPARLQAPGSGTGVGAKFDIFDVRETNVLVVEPAAAEAATTVNAHPKAAVRLRETLFMAFVHEGPSAAGERGPG